MYKLEDRILFDAAAVADVTEAQKEAEAQQEAAAQAAAEAEEAAAQHNDSNDSNDSAEQNNSEANDHSSLQEVLAAVNASGLGSDGQRIDVLVVSSSLDNADDICNTADADTLVVRYDARTTSAADLLQQISDALSGNVADSIAFATESGETAAVQLFADTDTSLDTVNNAAHQDFFNGLDALLDDGGKVNLFASNLASTAEGEALVDAISDAIGHDVAASSDETGSVDAGGDWDLEYSTDGIETDAASLYLDENLVDNFDALLEDHVSHEVAFINSSVMGRESIIEVLEYRGVEIVYIEDGKGLSQINDYFNEHADTKYDAVHIITHGNEGHFLVGSDTVDNNSLTEYYADSIAAWQDSLTSEADIMIYGCNLTAGSEGMNLVEAIADLTGADVAASDDGTGSRGDWELEYATGTIETAALAVHDYQYTLANYQVNSLLDEPIDSLGDGVMTLRKAISLAVDGDSITFAAMTTLGGDTVVLSASADPSGYGQLEITEDISINGTIALSVGYTRAIVTNDPSENFRLLYISETAGTTDSVNIYNMIFTSGEAEVSDVFDYVGEGNGGGIYNAGSAIFRDVDVENSSADIDGGGIYIASSAYLQIVNDTSGVYGVSIYSNTAGTSGGGIFNNSGDIELVGSISHSIDIFGNSAAGSGGGLYSIGDVTATYTDIDINNAGGDGGGVYISGGTDTSSFSNSSIYGNIAGGDGGGIYFFQGQDLSLSSSAIYYNNATGDGGGIYINESRYLNDIACSINYNTAGGDGGGVYLTESGNFYHERGYISYNSAGGSGGAIYMTKSGYGVSGGYQADLYLYAMDISGNSTNTGGVDGVGTIYYDGVRKTGVSGEGSTIAYMTAIDNNTVYAGGTGGSGGAIYQEAGDLHVWSSTLAFDNAATRGGAIYFSGTNLDVEFATLAYNEASTNSGADIYLTGTQDSVKIINSIIYDNNTVTPETQIVLAGATPVGSYIFNNNIYTNYATDSVVSTDLEAIVFTNGSGNIANDGMATPTLIGSNWHVNQQAIIDNLYLDTTMRNYSNSYARVLPLLVDYNQAIAVGEFGHTNIAWLAGTTDYNTSIEYDTRGNTRIGYQYDKTLETPAYVQNDTPSIGAFEPIYTIMVTSKDDGSTGVFFDNALRDGITLREALYWIDSYDAIEYATNSPALYNKERYVQFDKTLFSSTVDNTITLNGIYNNIYINKSVIIGMTPWLNDQLKENMGSYDNDISLSDMLAWGGYRAQDSVGRITINAGGSDRAFEVSGSSSTSGTRRVYINNLTVTNGHVNVSSGYNGRGGGIANNTNLYLSNVAVTNSVADNINSGYYMDDSGWGGGIYNSGNLVLVETTVSGNTAIGYSSSTDPASKAGLGGGIYSTGTLEIYSSSIYNNTAQASTNVFNQGAMGAGIYFDSSSYLMVANTTISNNTNNAEYSGAGDLHGQGSAIYLENGDLYLYYNTIILNTSVRSVVEATVGSSAAVVSALDYDDVSAPILQFYNNIIANNDYSFTGSPKTRDLYDFYIVVTDPNVTPNNVDIANNIIGWTTGLTINTGAGTVNNQYNIIGDPVFGKVANLNLEETLNYNGGKTQSHKVLDNSVAYQNGISLTGPDFVDIDQRGADRTYAGLYTTIGSYQPLQYIVVGSLADTNNGSDVGFDFASNSGGWMKADLQLREALTLADIYTQVIMGEIYTYPEGEPPVLVTDPTIILNQGAGFGELVADIGFILDGRTYEVTTSYNAAAHAYTITTLGALVAEVAPLVIDATDISRIINVNDNTLLNINVTVSYLTMKNGNSATQGGAVYNWENLTLDNVYVLDSTSLEEGGGIYSQTGMLTITESTIQGNSSSSNGGGLYYESNRLNISQSSFLDNTSTGNGGGIYVVGAQVFMDGSTVGDNISGAHGGGVYSDSSDFFTINSTIANNNADGNGGGMAFTGGGYLRMGYVTIANNLSGADPASVNKNGGGFYQSAGTLNIYDSIIAQNYQTSKEEANRNDFYLGTAITFTQAEVQNNILGVYTNKSATTINPGTNRIYNDGTGLYSGYALSLDTVLSDNGGPTKTVYVGNSDEAATGYGVDLFYTYNSVNNTYSLSLSGIEANRIKVDQRGEVRPSGTGITVGAYQKNSNPTAEYVFDANNDGDYNNYLNWTKDGVRLTSADQLDFNEADATYTISADLNMSNSAELAWTINWRSTMIVDNGVLLTVSDGYSLNANISVQGGIMVTDTGELTARSSSNLAGSGYLQVSGAISTADTTITANPSYLELLDTATLALATLSYSSATLNLVNSSTTSTVSYTYNVSGETQQVLEVKDISGASTAYGNLELSGDSVKISDTNLTVATLTLFTGASLTVNGNLAINDAATGGVSSAGSSITLTGDLTIINGDSNSLAYVDFNFNGTSAQTITLTADTTIDDITIDNSAGVSLDDGALSGTNFTFTNGAFTLLNGSSISLDSVSGADGDSARYFITDNGTVSLLLQTTGTHFVLAVEDGSSPGTYKWVDTVLSGDSTTRAYVQLIDGVSSPVTQAASSTSVTWNITTGGDEFNFYLADHSPNAAGQYFDQYNATLYNYSSGWSPSPFTTTDQGDFYLGHGYYEVYYNADDPSQAHTLRYALENLDTVGNVIVFVASHDFTSGADIVLNSLYGALTIEDGRNVSIFGLDPSVVGPSNITGAFGQQVLIIGGGGGDNNVTLRDLSFFGDGDYVLVNNEALRLENISVTGISENEKWTVAAISNTGDASVTIVEDMFLKLDGSAVGNAFTYESNSTLQYVVTPGAGSGAISIDDASAEFGSSIYHLTVDSDVELTLSERTIAYLVTGDVAVNGALVISGSETLTLAGANNDLGDFTANNSTVVYDSDSAQNISDVTYYNLTLEGTGDKTATNVTTAAGGNLEFADNITLFVSGDLTIGTGGSLISNNQGNVYYNGGDQTVSDLDYYNLTLGGTGTKTASNVTTDNNLIFDANVILTVSDAMDITGTLEHNSQGTVVYNGDSDQTIFGTTYYNLQTANGNKSLADNVTVLGTFTFDSSSGYLALGAYDLNIQGAIANASGAAGRYFATDNAEAGMLVLTMDDSTFLTRNIVVGTTSNWTSLTLTNHGTGTQTLSIFVKDGVDGLVNPYGAVNQTFTVFNTADFSMAATASSAAGYLFSPFTADVLHFSTTSFFWENKGNQNIAVLANSGNYYFDSTPPLTDNSLVVTNTNDSGFGSLRAAIEYANSHAGVDVITFSDKVFNSAAGLQTITLTATNGELLITDSVIILGPGINLVTVDGGASGSRIFSIDNSDTETLIMVQMSGMNISGGDAGNENGGGIYNNEFLILEDITVSNSSAAYGGGIYNDTFGSLYLNRVKIGGSISVSSGNYASFDGGGIYNNGGKIQAENLWVTGNTADNNGAGIFNAVYVTSDPEPITYIGEITLQNSTFDSNVADHDGSLAGNGGAIYNQGRLYGENLTLSNNTAVEGSALYIDSQAPEEAGTFTTSSTMFNATIALNTTTSEGGYAIYRTDPANDSLYINSSLILGNSDSEATPHYNNISNTGTNYMSVSNYILADSAGTAGDQSTDGYFIDATPVDRGGWVPTLALNTANTMVQNNIIDQGSNDGPSVYDARGYMRYGVRDIGAFEGGYMGGGSIQAGAYVAHNVDRNLYYTTISDAISNAEAGENIELFATRYYLTSELVINKDLILSGQGIDGTVLDAQTLYVSGVGSNRLLNVSDGTTDYIFVRVDGMTFRNGSPEPALHAGGAIYNEENLLLKNVSIYGSSASGSGGAIQNNQGYLYIEDSEIYNNTVTSTPGYGGGAIYNYLGQVTIDNSTLRGNSVIGTNAYGGAISSYDDGSGNASLTIISSAIYYNSVSGTNSSIGGAIYVEGSTQVEITNSTFAHNSAVDAGAMYFDSGGTYKFINITVAYNETSNMDSGAIEIYGGTFYSINSLFLANYNSGTQINHDLGLYSTVSSSIFNSISNINSAGYFADTVITDHGGWTKTIALAAGSAAINGGTNSGVPDYDQRGYDTSYGFDTYSEFGIRDIGAYEYEGYVAYYWDANISVPGWVGTSTIEAAGMARTGIEDVSEHVIVLVNTRILESDISIYTWINAVNNSLTTRTVSIYGAEEGGTVIDAGYQGQTFNITGNRYIPAGSTDYTYVMGSTNINRLTMTNGFTTGNGGAITTTHANESGSITINDSSLVNNIALGEGGAVYSHGANPAWGDKTDAVYNINSSVLAYNIAVGSGGAVSIVKTVNIADSTIAYNRSFANGGAIMVNADGGGSITHSTVARNFASTDGGGLYLASGYTVGNTILAKNRTAGAIWRGNSSSSFDPTYESGYDYYWSEGTLSNSGHNLVEYQNGHWIKSDAANFFGPKSEESPYGISNGDIIGPQAYIFSDQLVADHGGWTHTMELAQNSAALDKGSGGTADQRHYLANRTRDIGAYELNGIVATSGGEGFSTIAEAIIAASSGDTITLVGSRILGHDTVISKSITIQGDSADSYYSLAFLDAKSYGRIFAIESSDVTVNLANLILANGAILIGSGGGGQQAAGNGGAIFNAGTLNLSEVSATGSFAQLSGGAIYSTKSLSINTVGINTTGSSVTPTRGAYFSRNSAQSNGGAIYVSNILSITGVSEDSQQRWSTNNMVHFDYNFANAGGAIYGSYIANDEYAMDGVQFIGNNATTRGGAIYLLASSDITFNAMSLEENSAMRYGGAIYSETTAALTLRDVDLLDNFSFSDGGAVYYDGLLNSNATLTYYNSARFGSSTFYVQDNTSLEGSGGGFFVKDANLLHVYSTTVRAIIGFINNQALYNGGAICVENTGIGDSGYGIILGKTPGINDYNSATYFSSNDAGENGGAIYMVDSGSFYAYENVDIYDNVAGADPFLANGIGLDNIASWTGEGKGGAIYVKNSGDFTFKYSSDVYRNTARNFGGAFYIEDCGIVNIYYASFGDNASGEYYLGSSNWLTVGDSTVANAGQGGGLYLKGNGNIILNDLDFYDNHATAEGGAVYIENGAETVTIIDSSFDRNIIDGTDTAYGGAVYLDHAQAFNIANSTFAFNDNTAVYFGYGAMSLNFTTFAYNTTGADTGILGINFAGTSGSSKFVVNNSILHDGTDISGGEISGTAYSFGGTVTITAGQSTNNIYTNFNKFSGAANLAGTVDGSITAYLPYNDQVNYLAQQTATIRDSYANLVGSSAGTTSAFITANLYLATDMDYTGNRTNRVLALQSANSIANRYIYNGEETFAGNISETKSYDRSGAPVNGLMLIDYISSVYGWSSHSGGVSEYQVSADVKPFVVYSNGVALTEVAITEINSLYEGQWTWDSVNNRIVVRLADNADPNSTVMTTLNDTNSTIIYDQRGNMRSGVNVADASVVVSETNWTVYSEENNEYQASSDYAVTGVSYDGTSLTEGTDIENLEAGQWIWDSVNNLVVIKLAAGQSPSSHELDLTTTQTVYTYYTYGELNSTDTWIKVTVAESGTTYAKAEAADVHAGLGAFKANLYMTVTTNADNSYSPYVTYGMPEYMSMDNALADGVTLREGVYWIDTYDLTDLNVSGLPANAKFDADRYVKFADSMFEGDNNLINLSAGQITTTSNVVIGMIDNYNDIYYETGGASPTKYYFEGDNSFIAQNDESRITISGIDRYRIFDNSYSADHSAQEGSWSINPTTGINNMTLTDGFMSNSIINRGSVKWTYLARGGAIYNGSDATMYLNNTVVKDSVAATGGNFYRGHGGGIYNAGTMVIQDSTITGNFADGSGDPKGSYTGLGGGIYNNGTLTVARSLISENHVKSVVNKDDGLNYSATGGGIYNASGTLNLYSSTLSGNYIDAGTSETVDGAALTVWSGIANIYGNTIAYNSTYDGTGQPIGPARPGYAVYLYSGNVSLRNNILAQNYINGDTSQNRRDIIVTNTFELGTNFEDSYNIIGSYYLASGYYDFSAHTGTTHDILGFNSSGLVPNLNMSSELLYNGGMTQNYRIQTGSRAVIDNPPVDIYSGTGIDYDQRNAVADTDFGAYRITIGAYELLTKISVSSAADDAAIPADGIAYDYKNGRGGWTVNLRNALYLADENAVVTVTVVDNYDLVAGELLIFNGITLNTVDDEILTIDAAEKSRIFAITDPISAELVSVVLNNLNLINGKAVLTDRGGLGGAIYATERLTLNDVSIDNVSAESHGGAIYSLSGGLILTDVTITNAEAAGDGGAINQQTDAFTATRLTISGSKADGSGGAIYITDGSTFTIHGSLIHDNESGAYGGGIYFRGGDMNIYTTYVYNNAADSTKDGGGLYVNSSGNITIVYSTFGNSIDESLTENNGNTALRGAGIFVYAGSLAMTNSTISGNTAVQNGGGLYFDGTTLSLTYVTIANNYAGRGYLGGGVYMQSGTLNMINTVVAQNHALTTTSSTPSDFYVSTNASVNSAEFSAIGQSNFDFSVTTPDIHDNIVGNASGIIENLGLDTSLYDNGGGTPTLYVGTGSVLLGAATPISVTTSQNNHTPDSRGATPTIGAYEGGNFTTYYYVGDHKTGSSGRVNDTESWNTEADGSGTYLSEVGDFNDPGNLYVFTDNTYDGNLSTGPWTISDRSYVTVEAGGSFEISGAGSIQALVQRTGAVTNMVVDVENDGSLTFANALTQHVSLSSLGTGSYVSYTYGGTNQTVYTANYGNLTLSNSYYKTAEAGTITVNGTSTGLEVNNTNFILNGNLLGSANITLTDGTITGGAHDIISTGALSGTGANSISGNDISFASAPAYEGNITATGTVSISGQTGITGNISGSAVSIDGGGDTVSVTGNITSTSGSIDIQSANSTIYHSGNLISAADIAVYGTDSTITVGNATTSSGDIYLGSDTSGANVASLAILADSSVASVSGTIYLNSTTTELQAATLGSASNSNLEINGNLEATAGINTIYYNDTDSFTHAITIDDATLNFNIGSNNATITGAVSPTVPWLFNLNNFTVNDGTLGIVTTGNITINDVVTSALGNFHGTFSVTCKDIMFSGTNDFVGGYMDFIFNNSGYFKLSGDLEFENSITINDVMLYDSSVVNATLTSYNGNVTVGNVTTDPGSSTTPYVSEGNITLQAADGHSVSIGGTSGNINNVTLTSSTGTLDTATVAGPINNSGNLLITAGTTYVNSDVNSGGYVRINGALNLAADIAATSYVRASGDILVVANSSITGDNLQLLGGITGTGNLALGATGSGTNTLLGVTLTGGNLSLTDGSFEVDDLSTENISAANIYIASGAALDMGDHSLEATSGSITNAGTLNSDADISAAVNITNTSTGDLWAIGPVTATSGNIYNRGTFEVLTLGATAGGNIINSGLFSSSVVTAGGSISNTGSFTSTFLTQVDGNLSNTGGGTFTVTNVLDVVGNITNTGTLAVDTLNLIYSTSSSLSLNGDVSIYSLHVAPDKVVSLTSGNIAVNNFTFEGSGSSSKFNLASGTSLEVTGDIFYNDGGLYNGSYFNTAAGGQLIRTMDDSNVEYRVGNNSNVVVVTLNGTTGERIAVGVINGVTVNGETVAGIEETVKFTVNIDRNYGGGGYTNDLVLGINWATAMEGDKFDPTDASLFTFTSGEWTPEEKLTIDTPSAGRHEFINYVLEHNGTYTVANTGGDLTVPPIPNNVNIYEMANAHFMPMHTDLDCNIFLNFGVGVYPYFPYDIWVTPENSDSVGRAVYRQMEYRLISNPLTNPLYGQVPPPGEILGQAITEQASLTLTADAPIYLEVNGEYSVGKEWLPITEPATVENIEQFQEPITQGQIDQFYLDFGDREDIFEKAAPFKSDLDEMLDDLLAG